MLTPHDTTNSVYGMQYREKSIAKSLSKLSLTDLDIAGQAKFMEDAAAEDDVAVTWPLIMAVLVAVLLEFLVGFNIGVMVRAVGKCIFTGWGLGLGEACLGGWVVRENTAAVDRRNDENNRVRLALKKRTKGTWKRGNPQHGRPTSAVLV